MLEAGRSWGAGLREGEGRDSCRPPRFLSLLEVRVGPSLTIPVSPDQRDPFESGPFDRTRARENHEDRVCPGMNASANRNGSSAPRSRWRAAVTLAAAVLLGLGCGSTSMFPQGEVVQMSNPDFTGSQFRTLGLIAGDEYRGTIAMTGRIRQKLNDAGLTVLRTPGRFEGEMDAVASICATGNPEPDGVVFVRWDRLNLRACSGERYPHAFEAEGDYVGIDELADRLLRYLEIPVEDREGEDDEPGY